MGSNYSSGKRYYKNPVFTRELISWYLDHRRNLPWRLTNDPYHIWISEIILQQTRVAQGLPYYQQFIQRYPVIEKLSAAPLQEVLRLWQGLGYYSRARNLHRCAQIVVNEYGGKFPSTYHELIKLPGVGDYTASAVASFAFGHCEPVVEVNVYRVLSRVFGISSDISRAASRQEFKQVSRGLMDKDRPDIYNQAIMEFGALQCTPKQPRCLSCPFQSICYAYGEKLQNEFPVKAKKGNIRSRFFNYYLIRCDNKILMKERGEKDIWQGLFDFLLLENGHAESPLTLLESTLPTSEYMHNTTVQEPSMVYNHKLSHQHIQARFTEVKLTDNLLFKSWGKAFKMKEFQLHEIHQLPKPILINNYLKAAIF